MEPGCSSMSLSLRRRSSVERIRVLIADDHRVVREGLTAILRESGDLEVVGEARDGQEAVEKARELQPDVILMDVSMPRMSGVEATRAIKRESPHIGIVALTMYDEEKYIFDLVRAGATGYLLKDSDSAQIISAIRSIYKGESLIHPSVASKILAEFSLLSDVTNAELRAGEMLQMQGFYNMTHLHRTLSVGSSNHQKSIKSMTCKTSL